MAVKDADMTGAHHRAGARRRDGYSEAQMREALKSVALRGPVSLEEQVSALPFRIGDKAGFRPVRVIVGQLGPVHATGRRTSIKAVEQPIVIVAASLNAAAPCRRQRDQFARAALNSNQILKDIKVERSESFRFKGQDWHEIVAKAVEAESGQPIIVMQTIRFEPDRYVRMVGLSRVEQRDREPAALPQRHRQVDLSP